MTTEADMIKAILKLAETVTDTVTVSDAVTVAKITAAMIFSEEDNLKCFLVGDLKTPFLALIASFTMNLIVRVKGMTRKDLDRFFDCLKAGEDPFAKKVPHDA